MRQLDIETPKIRNPIGKVKIDTDKISRMIYDNNDDSLDFIEISDDE
jgi:hypothetical protein